MPHWIRLMTLLACLALAPSAMADVANDDDAADDDDSASADDDDADNGTTCNAAGRNSAAAGASLGLALFAAGALSRRRA